MNGRSLAPWGRDALPALPARYGVPVEDAPRVPRRPGVSPLAADFLPAAPTLRDPRAELAAELGADVAAIADYSADVAAVASALRSFDRRT